MQEIDIIKNLLQGKWCDSEKVQEALGLSFNVYKQKSDMSLA